MQIGILKSRATGVMAAENSALHHRNYILKSAILNRNNISQYYVFTVSLFK